MRDKRGTRDRKVLFFFSLFFCSQDFEQPPGYDSQFFAIDSSVFSIIRDMCQTATESHVHKNIAREILIVQEQCNLAARDRVSFF